MGQTLRPYQEESLAAVQRQFDRGVNSTLISLFVGLGKTVIGIEELYRRARRKPDFRAFWLGPAHLTAQTYGRMLSTYPEVFAEHVTVGHKRFRMTGVELADVSQPDARIIVGSIPTLIDRLPEDLSPLTLSDLEMTEFGGVRKSSRSSRSVLVSERVDAILEYGLPDEIIDDESHHAVSDGSLLLLTRLNQISDALKRPRLKLVGLTGTAWREDGRALANVFETIAIHRGYDYGIANGYLAPLATPIRIHAELGETVEDALKVRDWMPLMLQGWREKAAGRPTIAFLKTVAHSEAWAAFLRENGVRAAHLDGTKTITGDGVEGGIGLRQQVYADLYTGKCQIISNFAVVLEGVDLPPLSSIIWCRNSDNATLTTQAIGRVLRLFEGNAYLPAKTDALIIDVTGKNLQMLSAGTLAGFKYDPLKDKYEDDVEDEETTLYEDGMDMRDARPAENPQTSTGIRYSFARIIQKSGSDWFHDDQNDVLSLSIANDRNLIVTPPNYTYAGYLKDVAERLEGRLIHAPEDAALLGDFVAVSELAEMLSGYTLWEVMTDRPITGWLMRDSNLDTVLDYALLYMNTVEDAAGAFYKRNQHWRKQPMTAAQEGLLHQLAPKEDLSSYSCGYASQRISHIKAYDFRLARYLVKRLMAIQRYLPKQEKIA